MILNIINHQYQYDMEHLSTVFFPMEKIHINSTDENENIIITTKKENDTAFVIANVYDKKCEKSVKLDEKSDEQREFSVLLFSCLSDLLGYSFEWGILYGVRPAKLFHSLCNKYSIDDAINIFKEKYLVSEKKTKLTSLVAKSENKIRALSRNNSFSLYVSIPFCPSRCSYCSFVSHSIENAKEMISPYVDLLIKELIETAKIAKELSLRLETIYFGGGTPTTLSAYDLTRLFATIKNNFDLSYLREYTVEAGRPDTVTREKLLSLKNANVQRISINPQSFNDEVLNAIGRKHTSKQTIDAFNLAREIGFDNINMDFIAGLPKDDLSSFKNSIDTATNLGASSVTVHTLSLKSSAYMATRESTFDFSQRRLTSDMVDYSYNKLSKEGYYPYYMYRQSKSLGNLENVGWCKNNMDCLYNVFMMDETHSVFAVGAGAVTKLKDQNSGKIERIYNFKYPYEYVNNFEDIERRKKRISAFYSEYI